MADVGSASCKGQVSLLEFELDQFPPPAISLIEGPSSAWRRTISFLKNLGRLVRPNFCALSRVSVIMIPLKLVFCVIAALFAAVTVISAQRRDAPSTINCAVITGLSLIAMEWA
jgi:hypothetical protein